jgi:hypothetical protein
MSGWRRGPKAVRAKRQTYSAIAAKEYLKVGISRFCFVGARPHPTDRFRGVGVPFAKNGNPFSSMFLR